MCAQNLKVLRDIVMTSMIYMCVFTLTELGFSMESEQALTKTLTLTKYTKRPSINQSINPFLFI